LEQGTLENPDRVGIFADQKPDCACEKLSLSSHSPSLIEDSEAIARMVCTPMHVHSKKPEVKSSFFSHAFSYGASAQRLEHATNQELATCVADLIGGAEDRTWLGVVVASAVAIRALSLGSAGKQSFCVADAALEENPAHAELHCAYRVPEADAIEYRRQLMTVFNSGAIRHRKSLRAGSVWTLVPGELTERTLPAQWASLA
jgi:hypothetical protein